MAGALTGGICIGTAPLQPVSGQWYFEIVLESVERTGTKTLAVGFTASRHMALTEDEASALQDVWLAGYDKPGASSSAAGMRW